MISKAITHDGKSHLLALAGGEDLGFALRTTLAGVAAMFVAMWLQLDTPRWAIWTVYIVSPPVRGNALRKTVARIVGTFIGCTVGVLAVALFPQNRVGFYVFFALWLGACAYWATLRRGFVSYAASLGAFTSAIVSAGVSAAPLATWDTAMDRGCATILGILFALFVSNLAATSDDVPDALASRICALAANLLDWAARQLRADSADPMDAPFTAKILGLDEICADAIAENPALGGIKLWICGLPTALLSLQSAVLSLRKTPSRQEPSSARAGTDVLQTVADFLRSSDALDLPTLRRQAASLTTLQQSSAEQSSSMNAIFGALLYLLGALEALLTFHPPHTAPRPYPPARFAAHRHLAKINLIRAVVATGLGFVIWDLTAWPQGPVFMVMIAVAVVVLVTMENTAVIVWAAALGALLGGVIGLMLKYLLLVRFNDSLTLFVAVFPLLLVAAWIETRGKLAPLGVLLTIGGLYLIEPMNPQQYNFAHDINTLIAIVLSFGYCGLIFLAIGTPRKGLQRVTELFVRLRRRRWSISPDWSWQQRFHWETQMYDELQRLQAATKDPRHREHAVNLLLAGLRTPQSFVPGGAATSGV
jgi:uncharacterized membrane protein YccC